MRARYLLAAALLIMVGLAVPTNSLVVAAGTPTTITITGGALSITAPPIAADLGTSDKTVGGETVSGPLGQVQVVDARDPGAGSGWVASVISTAFTPGAGPVIPASAVGYTAGVITKVGTATYTADDPAVLTGVAPAVTATGITGDNSATWDPTINVAVPAGAATGVYTATITYFVT